MRDIVLEIEKTEVSDNSVAIWWLGQSSVIVKSIGKVLGFDLYLTDHGTSPDTFMRSYPSLINPKHLSFMDAVFCSHDHVDHLDPSTLKAISKCSSKTQFIVPRVCVPSVIDAGVSSDAVVGSFADKPFTLPGNLYVYPLKAAHETFESIEEGQRYQGYVVELNGIKIAHLGDTVMYQGLDEQLKQLKIDILMAPINGRDFFRNRAGVIGNLNIQEAAELAVCSQSKIIIPLHYDLFEGNRESPGRFVDYLFQEHPTQPCKIMARGERFVYTKPQ